MDVGEVLADKGLEKGTLDCPCTPEHRNAIAKQITNWKSLAPFIGLDSMDEEEIDDENRTVMSKRIALLRKWSEKRGKGATYLHLIKGFAQISRRDLIEKLCDIFSADADASQGAGAAAKKGNVPHLGDRPKLYELQRIVGRSGKPFKIIEQVSSQWEKLALALKFDGPVIEATKRNEHFQVENACRSILKKWLEGATSQVDSPLPVTWEMLLVCLEDIEFVVLATELRAELLLDL